MRQQSAIRVARPPANGRGDAFLDAVRDLAVASHTDPLIEVLRAVYAAGYAEGVRRRPN